MYRTVQVKVTPRLPRSGGKPRDIEKCHDLAALVARYHPAGLHVRPGQCGVGADGAPACRLYFAWAEPSLYLTCPVYSTVQEGRLFVQPCDDFARLFRVTRVVLIVVRERHHRHRA